MGKKGQAVNLVGAGVFTIVFAGILFIMGMIMLNQLYYDQSSTAGSVNNETATAMTTAEKAFTKRGECGFDGVSIKYVTNKTGGEIVSAGNYTLGQLGYWKLTAGGAADKYNNYDLNVSYTYTYSTSEACKATNKSIEGVGKFADYLDLIVLAIVIAVVIALVIGAVAIRRVS